ncbi:hypothetical protein IFM46972_10523 [Aspergillus udagawae]|uniref:Uncharacterized protein n=1 Tax=Aspergillus udagawae TaxID=91492 RepID=A0A8H3SDC7_9EURO|nr:hypothetical protein IFM46972_10523 [Aspergillus udagawae]
MADPITWGTVGWAIGEGALGWVGSKIMDGIFGHDGPGPVELQERSIKQIALVFQKALEAERLQEASDKLKSLINNVAEYNNAPSTSLFQLEDATTDSQDLLSTLAGLQYLGLPAYLVAASMRIVILQELLLVKGDSGYLLSIIGQISRSIDECDTALAKGFDMFNALGAGSAPTPIPILGDPIPILGDIWSWIFNGVQQTYQGSEAEVHEQIKNYCLGFKEQEMDPIEDLYKKVRQEWVAIREGALERAKAAGLRVPRGFQAVFTEGDPGTAIGGYVFAEGFPGSGIAGFDLLSPEDRAFAFDYDHSGKLDHVVFYRPGNGAFWIAKNKGGEFSPVYDQGQGGNGIGGYDLLSLADRSFAFDYDHSGKLDHVVLYRPGTGIFWIVKNNGDDRAFAFDYDHSGKRDHVVFYRPGKGAFWIAKNKGGEFSPVYNQGQGGNGIGGYKLARLADRAFAFDYDHSGNLDYVAFYRPGTGTFWVIKELEGRIVP